MSASLDHALTLGAALFRESHVTLAVRLVNHPYACMDDKNFKHHITGEYASRKTFSLADEIVYEQLVIDDTKIPLEAADAAVAEALRLRLIRLDTEGFFWVTRAGRRMLRRGYKQRRAFARGIFRRFS